MEVDAAALAVERLRRFHEGLDRDRARYAQARIDRLAKRIYLGGIHEEGGADGAQCELCYTMAWRQAWPGLALGPAARRFALRVLWQPPPDYGPRGLSPTGQAIWLHAHKRRHKRSL